MRRLLGHLAIALAALTPATAAADGLHVRIGVGPGYAIGSHAVGDTRAAGGGLGVNTELAIGTTIWPGVVVGGGTFPMVVPAPSYDDVAAGGHHLSATGPFVDYRSIGHPGLHVQGAILFTAGFHEAEGNLGSAIGFGFGGMLGVGYQRRLAGRWSLGPLLRVTYYHWSGDTDDGTALGLDLVSPALLVAVTYHRGGSR